MNKGRGIVSVAALRAEPSHRSEMTSQLLYGETVDLMEQEGNFIFVKMHFDGYAGWVHQSQILKLSPGVSGDCPIHLLREPYLLHDGMLLSAGSEIAGLAESDSRNTDVAQTACRFLNVPYLWSGRSFFGVDCSGFVQLVYKLHGIALPREAQQQSAVGQVLSFVEESGPGDLAFFEDGEGAITHVGLMLDGHKIIHAYGKVRTDELDSTGIYNHEEKRHTHRLRFLRTLLS